jgi:hypothetical protein
MTVGLAQSAPAGNPIPISVTGDATTAPYTSSTDAHAAETGSIEALGLSAQGSFSTHKAAVGDTLHYRIRVEWSDQRIPVAVLPPDSLSTPGFRVVAQSTSHKKTASSSGVRNVTEFDIALVGLTPGTGRVEGLRMRYRTGLAPREESLFIPAATLELDPALIALTDRLWVRLLLVILALLAVGFSGWKGWGILRARREAAKPKRRNFVGEASDLKLRLKSADSRAWLKDAEALCLEYLNQETAPESAVTQFDQALDAFYKKRGVDQPRQEWEKLRELFVQARWSAERREPHELADAFRTLKHCLNIEGDSE